MAKRARSPARAGRRHHVPQRTCVGCRDVLAKRELVRIVRTPQGVEIDPTGKAQGRGAYVHPTRSCWEAALGGPLQKALKVQLSSEELSALKAEMERLLDEQTE